jgi:hypothetical protein
VIEHRREVIREKEIVIVEELRPLRLDLRGENVPGPPPSDLLIVDRD